MKILLVKSFSKLTSVGYLATGLKSIGHEVHILVPRQHVDCEKMMELGIPVHFIDISLKPSPFNIIKIFKIVLKFSVLLNKNSYDLINLNLPEARLFGRISSLFSQSAVVSVIRGFENHYEKYTNFIDDATVTVTDAVKKFTVSNGVNSGKIDVIHNAIDLETTDKIPLNKKKLHKELNIDPNIKIIGMVSYFYDLDSKGHKTFLDAASIVSKKFKSVRFVLVGDDFGKGQFKSYYENYSNKLDIKDLVYFLGERKDVFQLMDSFYIHVFPTKKEGFGMVLIEAMARKTPNVVSKLEALEEIVVDKESCLFFRSGDAEDLARQLELLIENPDMSKRIGEAGREVLENHFDSKKMAYKYEATFRNAISNKSFKTKVKQIFKLFFSSYYFLSNKLITKLKLKQA